MRCGELAGVSKHQNGDTSDLDWERKVLNVRRSLGSDHGITYAKVPKSRNGRRTIALFESTVMALRAHTEQIQIEADISPRWLEPLTLSNSRATGTTVVDLMFRNPDGSALNPTNISQAFISEWDHAGLRKGVSLHGLRHLHASILLEGNPSKKVQPWSIERVAERLGDDPATVRSVYAHVLNRVERARVGIADIQRLYA
jgi:integrase